MYDPNQAFGQVSTRFKSRFNRDMTGDEVNALKSYAGYTSGEVGQDHLSKAFEGIDRYSGDLSNPWGQSSSTPSGGTPPPGQQTYNQANTAMQELLSKGYTDAMNNIDPNSPALQMQRRSFDRANQRGVTRARMMAAERGAARGTLGAGGFDAELGGIERAGAERGADFESRLIGQELESQRGRVMNTLGLASQMGNSDMSRQLQERLAQLDAQVRREGTRSQTGLGLLQTLLGDQRSRDALGFNYAQLGQNANMQSLMALLNGLG